MTMIGDEVTASGARGRGGALIVAALVAVVAAGMVATAPADQLQRQLTSHPADDRCPRWSPDCSAVVFESKRSGTWDLWIENLPRR
jgi:hypothetical protein